MNAAYKGEGGSSVRQPASVRWQPGAPSYGGAWRQWPSAEYRYQVTGHTCWNLSQSLCSSPPPPNVALSATRVARQTLPGPDEGHHQCDHRVANALWSSAPDPYPYAHQTWRPAAPYVVPTRQAHPTPLRYQQNPIPTLVSPQTQLSPFAHNPGSDMGPMFPQAPRFRFSLFVAPRLPPLPVCPPGAEPPRPSRCTPRPLAPPTASPWPAPGAPAAPWPVRHDVSPYIDLRKV